MPFDKDLLFVFAPFLAGIALNWFVVRRFHGLLFALVMLPTTIAHELAHLLVAIVTFSRPESISLIPKRDGDGGRTLGEVGSRPNIITGGFIGLAPLVLLPPLAIWLAYWQLSFSSPVARVVAGLYTGGLITASWPSMADWKMVVRFPVGVLLAGWGIWWLVKDGAWLSTFHLPSFS